MKRFLLLPVCCAVLLTACNRPATPNSQADDAASKLSAKAGASLPAIDADAFRRHIKTLSSDDFEGRSPSSAGEEKTVAYLAAQFKKLGLQPGNGDSYFQDVPLVTINAQPAPLIISKDGVRTHVFEYGTQQVIGSKHVTENVALTNSEIVFVGYGIVAPEYDWNDYAGLDVKGKTVVILVNDPGFATQDPALFKGNTMTYYGRWTYKYEEAARQGAAGALVVHETKPASYPWGVVQGSWSGPQHDLVTADKNFSRATIEGWIGHQQAKDLFKSAGMDYETAKKSAEKQGFRAKPLGLTASAALTSSIKVADSKNVLAVIPGSSKQDEYVIFTAHWDHLGIDRNLEGDQIYNGAIDNATGTAALLVLADAFMRDKNRPARSLVFAAVTAEESGLLGSKHYGENPVFPTARTAASINIDAMNVYGRTRDVVVIGFGSSQLEDYLAVEAKRQGRQIVQEPTPEKGYFYRSDHFNLAKKGVPSLYAKGGIDHLDGGVEAGKAAAADYVTNRYHKPGDEFDESWDLAGTLEDMQLYYGVARAVANAKDFPQWYEGTEFRAIREADLAAAK